MLLVLASGCAKAGGTAAGTTPPASLPPSPAGSSGPAAASPLAQPAASVGRDAQEITREEAGLSHIPYLDSGSFALDNRLLALIQDADAYTDQDYQAGIARDERSFLLGPEYKGSIAGTIGIGTALEEVTGAWGEPSLKKEDVLFYKTEQFYLGIKGEAVVEEAALAGTPASQYAPDILGQISLTLNSDPQVDLFSQMALEPEWQAAFEAPSHINGGGWYAESSAGISITDFHDDRIIKVHNNFAGELIKAGESDAYAIQYEDTDAVADSLYASMSNHRRVNELFQQEGKLSPGGKFFSIYEWFYSMLQYFTIRTVDGTMPDYQVHRQISDYAWLTDDYILYTDVVEQRPMVLSLKRDSEQLDLDVLKEAGAAAEAVSFHIVEVQEGQIKLQPQGNGGNPDMLELKFYEDGDRKLRFEQVK